VQLYLCLFVCVYTCIYMYIYIYMRMCVYVYTCIYLHMYMYMHIHRICRSTWVCLTSRRGRSPCAMLVLVPSRLTDNAPLPPAHVYMYVNICTHACMFMYVYTKHFSYVCKFARIICAYDCTYTCSNSRALAVRLLRKDRVRSIDSSPPVRSHVYVCMYVHVYVCLFVCVYEYMKDSVRGVSIYIYIYIHI
jgi:hypothetical protein